MISGGPLLVLSAPAWQQIFLAVCFVDLRWHVALYEAPAFHVFIIDYICILALLLQHQEHPQHIYFDFFIIILLTQRKYVCVLL